MLKKLLHYDFKAIFKYWWIGLISTFALSIGAGLCGHLLYIEKVFPQIVNIMSIFVIVIAIISIIAFSFATNIFVYVRFYKHFYSDEGYLTFTLPAKRSQLLTSKIISGTTISIITAFIVLFEVFIGCLLAFRSEFKSFYNEIIITSGEELMADKEILIGLIILILIIIILMVLIVSASIMFTYLCISIGSVITRKNKVITAIGVYYGANSVLTFVMQILYLFGFTSIAQLLSGLPEDAEDPIIFVGLLIPIFFIATVCAILYALNYWLLDKKLNLS